MVDEKQVAVLRKQNEQLKNFIDAVPSGIAACIIEHSVPISITVNQYLADSLGVTAGEMNITDLGQLFMYVHPEDRRQCRQQFMEAIKAGTFLKGVYRLCHGKTKIYMWVQIETKYIRNNEGNDVLYLSYTDVSELKAKEAALLESRALYSETVMSAKLLMWEYDIENSQIIYSQHPFTVRERQKFGWPEIVDHVPDSLVPFIDENDVPRFLEFYKKLRFGQDVVGDFWFKERPGQEPRCERISYKVIRNDDGKVVKAYGIGQNITAEKKVEERYRHEIVEMKKFESEDLIAKSHCNLTKNSVISYSTLRSDDLSLSTENTYDEGCERLVQIVSDPKERQQLANLIYRKNLIRRYQQGEMVTSMRYRRNVEGQAPVWASTTIHTYMMPETGDLECFSYTHDVSMKAMEEQAIGKLAELGFVELGVVDAVTGNWTCYRFDRPDAGSTLWVSQGQYQDDLERYVRDEVLPEQRDAVRHDLKLSIVTAALSTGNHIYTYANSIRRPDGQIRQIQFHMSYLGADQDTIFYCMRDVTAEMEQEHQQITQLAAAKLAADQANEAKSAFLASMSHDLRTPLNGIIGFTNVAIKETNPQKKQSYLEKVQASANLLLDLVNDTLELSRIESGKMKLEPEVVSSRSLGTPVVTALRPSAELKNIKIDVDISNLPDEVIWVDKLKYQKIMLNLLSNAIKYTPSGGHVTLYVAKLSGNSKEGHYRVIVEDDGIGMSQEFQHHLYEPFTQEKQAQTKTILGTGLGLAIVKRIVDLMGGTIRVESELGKGSRFIVELTSALANEEALHAAQKETENNQERLAGKHILLVEDNYLNAEIATVLLQEKAMLVHSVANGREAVDAYANAAPHTFDAILMDIRMPVMDGYEATTAIRQMKRADALQIPIIALTADVFEEDRRRFAEVGMNDYAVKPINPPKLFEALLKYIP